jgi:serine/threonine-protein kinase
LELNVAELPRLTLEQVAGLVPGASNIRPIGKGGQKLVFCGDIDGRPFALKFALLPALTGDADPQTEVEARAAREVETMRDCDSPHMVKLGPVGLTVSECEGQRLLFFSEEFVDGEDVAAILQRDRRLAALEVVRLGLHVADAIRGLWDIGKIHRDIKPHNIVRGKASGDYVLLDAGYAFDVVGESLSQSFVLVGTVPYFPPERFDYTNRRSVMDFRSDLFSLGVTMYQAVTGVHPFWTAGETSHQVFARILNQRPRPPSTIQPGLPAGLDDIILRLLGKAPHLRYRKIEQFVTALRGLGVA